MASTTTTNTDFPDSWADFLSSPPASPWHDSAPKKLRKTAGLGSPDDIWTIWASYLSERKKPRDLKSLFSTRRLPLLWALSEGVEDRGTPELIERLGKKRETVDSRLEEDALVWMAEAAASGHEAGYGFESVAWAAALPRLASVFAPETWWSLLRHLATSSIDAAALPVEQFPLLHQLLAAETALTLAYLFPELPPCRKLGRAGRHAVAAGMEELLDGEGLPGAENMSLLRPLLACWTRCRALGRRLPKDCFNKFAKNQFEWVLCQTLRWMRADGSQSLASAASESSPVDWLAAALEFDEDPNDRRIAVITMPGGKKSDIERASRHALIESASHSEWSRAAVLRPCWSPAKPCLSVLYPGKEYLTELALRREVIWSGPWTWEVTLDGRPLSPVSEWDESCWVSDDDADFLELQIELTEGVRIQRQMVMARDDRFLLAADAILCERHGQIDYRACLPLADHVEAEESAETRDIRLIGRRRAAVVLPLALPEWRCDERVGTLRRTGDGLELRQTTTGSAMYCPLWFDLDPRRSSRRLTWRHLTVAESLETQPLDVAAGYRARVGDDQWLIYRSLAPRANRTLLGHNLSSETLVARFADGEVETLVETE